MARISKCILLAGAASVLFAGQAAAQDTGSDDKTLDEVIVTGSRIQNGNNTPTPVTVVPVETLQNASPATIADGLNKLPQFVNSNNQSTNDNASSNAVGNFLNLRGLGRTRTLILFDGHRVPDTAQSGGVDVNTIPQFLLSRVDVVTGGASAVYGSDAVAGVVNFIVDTKFTGLKVEAEAGVSDRNDNGTQRFGIGWGTDVQDGRGHFLASYNYANSEGIDSKTSRRHGALVPSLVGGGSAANPFIPIVNARLAVASAGGFITSGPQAGRQFALGGDIVPFANGAPTTSPGLQSGGDGLFYDAGFLASLETHQGYARFDYDLTDKVSAYVQGTYTTSKNDYPFLQFVTSGTLFTNNAFLSPASSAALSQGGATTFTIAKTSPEYLRIASKTDNYFVNGGFKGEFGDGFAWDISYTNSQSEQRTASLYNINNGKLAAALDAVRAPNGQIVCQITLVDPARYPGCVPLNLLGAGSITPEALDYVRDRTKYDLTQKMDDLTATLTGSLFSTAAGPVRFALAAEHRETSLKLISTSQPSQRADCTGLRANCTPFTTLYASNVVANAAGKQNVSEAAAEVDVPLLKDVRFAESASISGAARFTHYNTSGDVVTWKIGGDWSPTAELRFRATRSRDIRAPNLNDLFAPTNQSPTGFNDTHTGISGVTQFISNGNEDLEPEKADTFTAGFVYRPAWLDRFSIAIDYYDIKIKDAITGVNGYTAEPVCEASNGTDPLCDLVIRPLPFSDRTPANFPTAILSRPQNVAEARQTGIDTEVNYGLAVAGGDLNLRALVTYVDRQQNQILATSPNVEYAGTIYAPRWRATLLGAYKHGDWTVSALTRFRSAVSYNKDPRLVYRVGKVSAVAFMDAFVSKKVSAYGGDGEVYVSIQNLFDTRAPMQFPNVGAPGFSLPAVAGDDVVGRRFNVGLRAKF